MDIQIGDRIDQVVTAYKIAVLQGHEGNRRGTATRNLIAGCFTICLIFCLLSSILMTILTDGFHLRIVPRTGWLITVDLTFTWWFVNAVAKAPVPPEQLAEIEAVREGAHENKIDRLKHIVATQNKAGKELMDELSAEIAIRSAALEALLAENRELETAKANHPESAKQLVEMIHSRDEKVVAHLDRVAWLLAILGWSVAGALVVFGKYFAL